MTCKNLNIALEDIQSRLLSKFEWNMETSDESFGRDRAVHALEAANALVELSKVHERISSALYQEQSPSH
jgi:hypothetical protein